MDRTITVDGVGRLNIPPDLVILYTTLETRETKYSNAIHLAQEKEDELREAIARAGFDPEDLKTASFRVEPIKDEKKDRFGTKSQVVGGFACYHLFKLMFEFDQDRLSKVISQITRSELKPNFSVKYSVQRANFVKDELMRDAMANAQHKAFIFADAADCKLGKLLISRLILLLHIQQHTFLINGFRIIAAILLIIGKVILKISHRLIILLDAHICLAQPEIRLAFNRLILRRQQYLAEQHNALIILACIRK